MDVMEFSGLIENHILEKYPDARFYDLTDEDHDKINRLVKEKYGTWEWNFGYSPNYNYRKIVRTERSGSIEFNIDVAGGIIRHIKIFGDYFNRHDTEDIENALTDVAHREDAILDALAAFTINDYFDNLTLDELMAGFFN
jgi:lipoate-protein ligase A